MLIELRWWILRDANWDIYLTLLFQAKNHSIIVLGDDTTPIFYRFKNPTQNISFIIPFKIRKFHKMLRMMVRFTVEQGMEGRKGRVNNGFWLIHFWVNHSKNPLMWSYVQICTEEQWEWRNYLLTNVIWFLLPQMWFI